ncbi:hypothetical protein Q8F55_003810 [Vanrija albida]|uniref:Uncharacterized protein n=1 Tax=Vanrija albida TaxID=181172 RepID=A0ABR3Q568_9TREE
MTETLRTVTTALTATLTSFLSPLLLSPPSSHHTGLDLWLHADAPRFYDISEREFVCRRVEPHCACCAEGEAELCCVGPGHCAATSGDCAVVSSRGAGAAVAVGEGRAQ